jgi:hypothetical protein
MMMTGDLKNWDVTSLTVRLLRKADVVLTL